MKLHLIAITAIAAGMSLQAPAQSPSAPRLSEDLRRNLVLHFDFQSAPAGGNSVIDLSGHGNNGRAVNVRFEKDDRRGGAARFGLNDSYITVPNRDELNPPTLTATAWIKTSWSDNVWRRIIDKQWNHGFAVSIGGAYTGKGRETSPKWKGRATSEINGKFFPSDAPVSDGLWHHIATTFDGRQQNLYVDGNLQREGKRWSGSVEANPHDLTIGANRSNPTTVLEEVDASFNGLMGDVMLFNRALTGEEVRSLFKSQGGTLAAVSTPAAQSGGIQGNSNAGQGMSSQAEKLKTLKQAFEQGLLSKEDYDRKVKVILDGI